MSYLIAVLILGMLILLHEAGHLAAARMVGIPVERFSIGFGPKLWAWQRGETEYRVSLIPLGGYVMPAIKEMTDYTTIPLMRRIVFSAGGPLANLLFAVPALALLIILNGHTTAHDVLVAPWIGLWSITKSVVMGFLALIGGSGQVSSVVGIVAVSGEAVASGLTRSIQLIAVLTVNLCIFNLLPLPPLDGGKMVLDTLTRFMPRLLKLYIPAVASGWLLIIALMLYATTQDVIRLA